MRTIRKEGDKFPRRPEPADKFVVQIGMATDPGSWQGIEFRHLAALEAIAGEGSFSAAALKLGYSQSAVSGQIATLERLVGARLVARIRGSRRVTLTREGERMGEHARAINARLNAAREDVGAVASAGSGTIPIGTFQSVSQTLLPQVVHELTTSKPRLAASLREDPSVDHLATMLESGELDVAFVLLPVAGEELETVEVLRDPWLLAVRTDHPLVWQQRSVTAGDLSNLPLIAFEQVPTQKIVEGSLRAAGASLRVVTRLADYASVLSMVSAGLGCGLVPRLAVEAEAGTSRLQGLRFLPIAGQPPRLVALAWRRDRAGDAGIDRVVRLALAAAREDAQAPVSAHA
jgi:molybdate transport repressor ModE-like protein